VLDVDVLAVQEFKTLPRARERTNELLRELDRLTAGHWQAAFDDCPNEATQHTGLLWNASRATATALRTQGELNPHGEPCKDSLRPGYGAHFRFGGGQSAHVISVHYKSGTERRSHELRKSSFEAMAAATQRAQSLVPGADVIFAGDFNTMGCPKCSPSIAAHEERSSFGELLARAGLAWAAADLDCSEYFRGDGNLLDGFALSRVAQAKLRAPAQVSGYCAVLGCRDDVKKGPTAARDALSDHCPLVLELGKN
jgi:endonuclease/exonuclease/phosphatase family metal-dependent hydrolase